MCQYKLIGIDRASILTQNEEKTNPAPAPASAPIVLPRSVLLVGF